METRKKPKLIRMQNLRRVVQVLAFAAFLYLFALTIGRFDLGSKANILTSKAPIDTFFRMDPLLGLATMIATRHIISVMLIYGLPIVILSALAGRFFCGWICPLGTALDATDTLFFRKRRKVSGTSSRNTALRNVKYYIFAGMLIAAVFGSQIAYFLDPITIITRAFTFSIFPLVTQAGQVAGQAGIALPLVPQDVQYFFRLNFLAAAVLIGILAANSISRRFWCRNLCPLGALLGLLSRFSIVRRMVRSDCIGCKKCIPDCKMGAILDDPTEYQAPECVYCYSCTPVCPTLGTRIAPSIATEGYHGELDLDKRRIMQAAGLGLVVAALGKTNVAAKTSRTGDVKTSSAVLIRPPGALPEDEFVDRCIRCSECMKVCPTNGLQPALTEAGFEGIWTPVLIPRIGECTRQCNLCSQVCSSQAIQPVEVKEKDHIFIATAVIDRSQCIAWNSNKQCLVCDECCSYRAVKWKVVDGVRRPFVEEHKCVGCGICENVCPIQPVAAIRAFSFGDKRHMTREAQRAFLEQAPRAEQ
jgi:polyferredoxin